MGLEEAVTRARKEWYHKHGKCTMCTVGDEPKNGLHVGKHKCGNENACLLCHNAGMEYGDQCSACGRIEKSNQ